VRYRVNEFRRFLPKVGNSGLGLVQFWGPKARRRFQLGSAPPPFVSDNDEFALRTVEVSDIEKVTDAKH